MQMRRNAFCTNQQLDRLEEPVSGMADFKRLKLDHAMTINQRQKIQMVYPPLLAKVICNWLIDQIGSILATSRIEGTKKMQREFTARWTEEVKGMENLSRNNPKTQIHDIAKWWYDDEVRSVIDMMHHSFKQEISYQQMCRETTADLLGWLYTLREFATEIILHDNRTIEELQKKVDKSFQLSHNYHDFSFVVKRYSEDLIALMVGKVDELDNRNIANSRVLLRKMFRDFSGEIVVEWLVRDSYALHGKPCQSERCKDCPKWRCRELKQNIRDLEKDVELK